MTGQLGLLRDLQRVDSGIQQRQQWISELDDGTKAKRKLVQARKELEAAEEQLKELESTYRAKELELRGADAERKERSARAYGGTIADSRELAALERKIEELKRRAGVLEDDLLGLMERIEALRVEVGQKQALAKKLLHHARLLDRDYKEARARLDGEIAALNEERTALVPTIQAPFLQEYEALRAKLGGVAIATVQGNLCSACRNSISISMVGRVNAGRETIRCENCRRILCPEG